MSTEEQAVFDESAPSEESPVELDESTIEEQEEPKPDEGSEFVETDNEKVQKRFGKLTAEKYAAQRRAEEAEARVAALEKQELESKLNQPAPTEAQFDYDNDAYLKALREHERQVGINEGKLAALEEHRMLQERAQLESAQLDYNKKIAEFIAEEDAADFHVATQPLNGLNMAVAQEILRHEDGPAISYYLAKNLDVAQQLHVAQPIEAGRILAQIESKVSGSKNKNKISQAGSVTEDPPADPIKPNESPWLEGATFE
jgi:hypothetical protein